MQNAYNGYSQPSTNALTVKRMDKDKDHDKKVKYIYRKRRNERSVKPKTGEHK
jgi:hypothetical protein